MDLLFLKKYMAKMLGVLILLSTSCTNQSTQIKSDSLCLVVNSNACHNCYRSQNVSNLISIEDSVSARNKVLITNSKFFTVAMLGGNRGLFTHINENYQIINSRELYNSITAKVANCGGLCVVYKEDKEIIPISSYNR